jgi:DNA replication and repair protein RecF
MRLIRIHGDNFRRLEAFELLPCAGVNLFLGANTAGKTSLLEAIYALGRGRSFRGTPQDLAGPAGPHWQVHGKVTTGPDSPESQIGVEWSSEGLRVRVNRNDAPLHELVSQMPVQAMEPDSHRLLEDGPGYRRRYLDWGVFHVEHSFFPAWRRYQRALRQRNRGLKTARPRKEVQAWDEELCESGQQVQDCREQHLQQLRAAVGGQIRELLGEAEWSLELARGWPVHKTLSESLSEHYEQDRRQGQTVCGPHRAELRLRFAGRSAKHQVSRGQQKLLVAALLLSQARLIAAHTGRPPILLVDDFPAELGPAYQDALLGALAAYPGQAFLTSIEATPALNRLPEEAVFHVEHGRLLARTKGSRKAAKGG